MARRKKQDIFDIDTGCGIESSVSSPKRTLTIRLDDNGKLDASSMRDQTLETLRQAIQGSAILRGEEADQAAIAEFEVKKAVYAQVVPALYAVLGSAEALIVSNRSKIPYEEARKVFFYSESDIAKLSEPTAIVLAKRMPEGFGWAEEVALALTLVQIHQEKLIALKETRARLDKKLVDIRKEPETVAVQ